ncbi:E3 ubiquitin-protein ligase WAV3-like [Euphorbia lathyris]|uniref:E3 ubiquitin-protein ligase WAV3-like n=1 Tax=Euphorbia lathyris TaxID=212925 RepID=UPI0033140513
MGVGGLKRAARKMVVAACASFSSSTSSSSSSSASVNEWDSTPPRSKQTESSRSCINSEISMPSKNICAICLEVLTYSTGNSPGQAIFTAQCCHSFHFACISSNVRHGSVTCPICRAHWTQLPRNLNQPCPLSCNQTDPVFQILDDSIANFRVHRRSFLRSARYNDDDPIDTVPDHTPHHPRLHLSLVPLPPPPPPPSFFTHRKLTAAPYSYLCVKLTNQRPIDLVLVASPSGPHLRLVKQSMALVVFSLRPVDRLAIVTYSPSAARVFPLRRMTSCGKRTALQVIERLFFVGQADPTEGVNKGIKILEDRAHKNPHTCILHLSDCPTSSYHTINMQLPIPIHRFGLGTSNGFVIHEFEEFLIRLLGGVITDVQLRIGEGRVIRIGELRGNDEKRILLDLGNHGSVCVKYSYMEGGVDECSITGERLVNLEDKGDTVARMESEVDTTSGRTSSVESWDYHDPYMARRWAKHLHTYRL